jgi:hypothetical protein
MILVNEGEDQIIITDETYKYPEEWTNFTGEIDG